MLKDKGIAWKLKYKLMYASEILACSAETGGVLTGKGTGAPVMGTVNSLPCIGGIQIDAAGADAVGDEIHWWMPVPSDMDTRHPLKLRVHWISGSATAADVITFVGMYTAIVPHSTTVVVAATALNTVIPADLVTAAHKYSITDWGIVDGSKFANGGAITWELRCSVAQCDLVTEYLYVVAVEFAYTPKMTEGPGRSQAAYNPGF